MKAIIYTLCCSILLQLVSCRNDPGTQQQLDVKAAPIDSVYYAISYSDTAKMDAVFGQWYKVFYRQKMYSLNGASCKEQVSKKILAGWKSRVTLTDTDDKIGLRIYYGLSIQNMTPRLLLMYQPVLLTPVSAGSDTFTVVDSFDIYTADAGKITLNTFNTYQNNYDRYMVWTNPAVSNDTPHNLYISDDYDMNKSDPRAVTFTFDEIDGVMDQDSLFVTGASFTLSAEQKTLNNHNLASIYIMPLFDRRYAGKAFTGKAANVGALCPPNCPSLYLKLIARPRK